MSFSDSALRNAGLFEVEAVRSLYAKCKGRAANHEGVFSNTDNMGLVGILSTQLVVDQFIKNNGSVPGKRIEFTTFIDRVYTPTH